MNEKILFWCETLFDGILYLLVIASISTLGWHFLTPERWHFLNADQITTIKFLFIGMGISRAYDHFMKKVVDSN
jgi:hypothetical protein